MLPWDNICTLWIAAGLSWGNWDTGTAVGGAGFVDGVGQGGEAQEPKNHLSFAPYVCSNQVELDGTLALCIQGQTSLPCPYQRGEVQGTSLFQSLSLKQNLAQLSVMDQTQVGGLHLAA